MIYEKYAQTAGQMSVRDLLNFLLNEQREQVGMADALKLIEKYELDETGKARSKILFEWELCQIRETRCSQNAFSLQL